MSRVLLSLLWLTVVVVCAAEPPPQDKAAAPLSTAAAEPSSTPKPAEQAATRMESSLEKQRAAIRKQVTGWLAVAEPQPADTFLLPWPKAATGATAISFNADFIPCDPMPEAELDRLVKDAAERQKVSPKIVRAMIIQESAGRPCAVSTAGAQGLMQLMPDVQREYDVADPFDPRQSVEAGTKLLRSLIDRYAGNLPKALAAYNAGPGAVDRAGGIPPIPETTNYVSKIVKRIE